MRTAMVMSGTSPVSRRMRQRRAPASVDVHRASMMDKVNSSLTRSRSDYGFCTADPPCRATPAIISATTRGCACRSVRLLVDQHAPQPVARCAALSIAEFHGAALSGEYLDRYLAAVFARHHPLDGFQKVGADAAVIFELLATVVDPDRGALTDMLVVGGHSCAPGRRTIRLSYGGSAGSA